MTQIAETAQRFVDDPASAQTAPAVTAVLSNQHARLSAGPFNWESDLPPALGGGNVAPSPTAYLLGSLAGCAVAFLSDTLAPQFGVEVRDLRAVARCRSDLAGLVGLAGHSPQLQEIELDIALDSPSAPDAISAMRQAWLARCPVYLALGADQNVTVTFS